MKIILPTIFIFILCCFCSCNKSQDIIKSLESENERLQKEISDLKSKIELYGFMPIVYPKSENVKLGEKYEAYFFIGAYSNKISPIVTVYNKENPSLIDTLPYDSISNGNFFSFTPKAKGHYTYFANMKIPRSSDTIQFPIRWEFDIK